MVWAPNRSSERCRLGRLCGLELVWHHFPHVFHGFSMGSSAFLPFFLWFSMVFRTFLAAP